MLPSVDVTAFSVVVNAALLALPIVDVAAALTGVAVSEVTKQTTTIS